MSWLDEEAEKDKETQHREDVLRRSNWWAEILAALEREVCAINSHDHWRPKLNGYPIRFGRCLSGEEYHASRSSIDGSPAVIVAVQNKYDHILIGRVFVDSELSKRFKGRERLHIITTDHNLILTGDGEVNLVTPQDAAQYILKPVVESLKTPALVSA